MTKAKPPKTKKIKAPKLKEIYGKKAPDYARRRRADILQKMVTQAEEDGLYESLDVTPDQVRVVELEAELADKDAEIARLRRALENLVTQLVNALADDAAAHPEKLGDMGELLKGTDELLKPSKKKP